MSCVSTRFCSRPVGFPCLFRRLPRVARRSRRCMFAVAYDANAPAYSRLAQSLLRAVVPIGNRHEGVAEVSGVPLRLDRVERVHVFTERAPGALALASGYGCQWWLLVGLTVDHLGTPLVSIQQDAERLPEVICAEVRM